MNVLTECSELNAQPRIRGYRDIGSPEGFGIRDHANGYQLLIARTTGKAYNAKHDCRHERKLEPLKLHELLLDCVTSRIPTEQT